MNTRPAAIAEIDLQALRSNLRWVRNQVPKTTKILAVVKANAYGHGAIPISRELSAQGIDMLGVALVEEGIALRKAGIQTPILVMGGIFDEQAPEIVQYTLTPVIYRLSLAQILSEAARKSGGPLPVHIKLDTGMGRLGLRPESVEEFVLRANELSGLKLEGIMTHFSEADLADKSFAREQLSLFLGVCTALEKNGVRFTLRHVANSAAIADLPETHLDMVRPGLILYGYHPGGADLPIQPVLTWKTRIVYLKRVPAGTSISYGRTFVTGRESLIATLPVGYADGYSRSLSNAGEVLIRGCRVPVVGRVCMDMTMVDVTKTPGVEIGDDVLLIGSVKGESMTAPEVAKKTGTVCYETLSRIGERVARELKEGLSDPG